MHKNLKDTAIFYDSGFHILLWICLPTWILQKSPWFLCGISWFYFYISQLFICKLFVVGIHVKYLSGMILLFIIFKQFLLNLLGWHWLENYGGFKGTTLYVLSNPLFSHMIMSWYTKLLCICFLFLNSIRAQVPYWFNYADLKYVLISCMGSSPHYFSLFKLIFQLQLTHDMILVSGVQHSN